jgi:hypothetical protein
MAMVAADALVVSLLVGRKWRAGCILAIMVAAGGNMVYAAALVDGRLATLCGCVGRLALTPVEHVALSMVIFGLAGWALAGPHAPARDTAARAAP